MGFLNKLADKATTVAAEKHLATTAAALTAGLKHFGIKVETSEVDSGIVPKFRGSDPIDGMIYPTTIGCFSEILGRLVKKTPDGHWEYTPNHICLTSLTQVGKTTLLNLMSALGPCISMLTNEEVNPIFLRLLINDCSLEAQAVHEAKNFISLYGNFKFKCGEFSTTIKDYMERLKQTASTLDVEVEAVGATLRTSPNKIKEMAHWFDMSKQYGLTPILTADESHARSGEGSVMSQMISQIVEQEHEHWLKKQVAFVGVSATNFALGHTLIRLGYTPPIFLPPGKNYTGYPYEPVTAAPVKVDYTPKVLSIPELSKMAGSTLHEYRADLAASRNKFKKHQAGNYEEYRLAFVKELAKVILYLFDTNPAEGRGMIIRLIKNNDETDELWRMLREELPNINLLPPYHANNVSNRRGQKFPRMKDFIKKGIHDNNQNYVVLVTGRGGMGTSLPSNLRYGINFVQQKEFQTLQQDIAGRLTGYDKGEPWVILTEDNAARLNRFIQSGKITNKKGGIQTPYAPHVGGEYSENRRSVAVADKDIPPQVFEKLQQLLRETCEYKQEATSKGARMALRRKKGQEGYVLLWRLLDGAWLKKLESKFGCQIMRPGDRHFDREKVKTEVFYEEKGKVNFAARYEKNRSKSNSESGRDMDYGNDVTVRPTIVVGDDFQIHLIRFRTMPYTRHVVAVKPASMYYNEDKENK